MQKQILDELKDLKVIVYKFAGISEQSNELPISIEAIEKFGYSRRPRLK